MLKTSVKTSSDTNWTDNFIMLAGLTLGARRAVYFSSLCPHSQPALPGNFIELQKYFELKIFDRTQSGKYFS